MGLKNFILFIEKSSKKISKNLIMLLKYISLILLQDKVLTKINLNSFIQEFYSILVVNTLSFV